MLPLLADEFDLVERVARRLGRDPGPVLDATADADQPVGDDWLSDGGRRRPGPFGVRAARRATSTSTTSSGGHARAPRRSRSAPASSRMNSCSRSGPSVRLWSSALRAGKVEPLMPSTSAAWASLPAPDPSSRSIRP